MENFQVSGDSSSHSESTKIQHSVAAMAVYSAQSPGHVEAPTTLEAISAQLQQIQLNLDTLRE